MSSKTLLVNAVYDLDSGEFLLQHPTEENTFVKASHFNDIMDGQSDKQSCVYTERQVCVEWRPSLFSTTGQTCTQWGTVRTCRCD